LLDPAYESPPIPRKQLLRVTDRQNLIDTTPLGEVLACLCDAWPPQAWSEVHVAVAISGGCDSMALLRTMLKLKEQVGGPGQLSAMHVNHQLRGAESDADATWCEQQCEMLGVPLKVLQGKVAQRAQAEGDGIEAAARGLRYELLTQAAEEAGIRYLATAHTRDDQVETILFRILRGSGLQGLRGIPSTRPLSPVVTLVRPLLACSRKALESYLSQLGQTYRSDSSNQDRRFARNRLRHELLPLLRAEHNQEVDAALLRLAAQADETQQFVELHARGILEKCLIKPASAGELKLCLSPLSEQADVVVCETLRLAWREAGLAEQAMTYPWWRRMAELVKNPDGGEILNLPGDVRASIFDGQLLLRWRV